MPCRAIEQATRHPARRAALADGPFRALERAGNLPCRQDEPAMRSGEHRRSRLDPQHGRIGAVRGRSAGKCAPRAGGRRWAGRLAQRHHRFPDRDAQHERRRPNVGQVHPQLLTGGGDGRGRRVVERPDDTAAAPPPQPTASRRADTNATASTHARALTAARRTQTPSSTGRPAGTESRSTAMTPPYRFGRSVGSSTTSPRFVRGVSRSAQPLASGTRRILIRSTPRDSKGCRPFEPRSVAGLAPGGLWTSS